MSIILIIASFQALLLAFLLFTKRGRTISDTILSAYFFVTALTILFAYLEIYNRSNGLPYPWLINSSIPVILLIGPLLWLYVRSLTKQHFKLNWSHLLLAVPFVFVTILFTFRFYLQSTEVKVTFESGMAHRSDFVFPLVVGMIAISNVGYGLWSLLLISRYRKMLKTYFSQTDTINLGWLKFVLIMSLVSSIVISGLYSLEAAIGFMDYDSLQVLGYSIISVYILILGIYGLKQGNVFVSVPQKFSMNNALESVIGQAELKTEDEQFIRNLLEHMKAEKPHRNPDLTLAILSEGLRVNPEYLSAMLNGRLNMTFFDFVNHHRVEDFKTMCKNAQSGNLTLMGLAYDCGFNSKATFNRVFKKMVGCTPSEYLTSKAESNH